MPSKSISYLSFLGEGSYVSSNSSLIKAVLLIATDFYNRYY